MEPAELRGQMDALTQRVDLLTKQVKELHGQNQELKDYINRTIPSLQQQHLPEPQVCPPDIFSGDRKQYRQFLNACKLMFRLKPRTYPTEQIKVCAMISYLRGEPRAWADGYLEREDPIVNSFTLFCDAMSLLYEDPNKQLTAETAIRSLKQGRRRVEDYIVDFKRWSHETEWNPISLRNQFRLGLSEPIKDELSRVQLPDTLEELITLCVNIDRRLRERKAEKQTGVPLFGTSPRPIPTSPETPMDICTIRGPLTPDERNRRRNMRLCMYCASPTHTVSNCSLARRKDVGESPPICKIVPTTLRDTNYLTLPLLLQWDQQHLHLEAMIDTGACGNFIDSEIVSVNKIPLFTKPYPVSVSVIDGSPVPSGPITHHTQPLLVVSQDKHIEHISFDVISSPHFKIILGLPWIKLHQPTFNWTDLTPIFSSPYCDQTCSPRQTKILNMLLPPEIPKEYSDFQDVFSKKLAEELPPHRGYDCPIELIPGCKIPVGHIYPLSQPELSHLKEYIQENLRKGFIRPSTSPAGSSMFFVKNKDNSLRPIIDYRELNKVTVKNRYPLPLIPELIERLGEASYFTKLDLRGAYNLVRIRKGDEWKTAFRTRYGLYEYLVMPFGLCNAPATFQHFINDVFHDLLDTCVVVYLDDILVYSKTLKEHHRHVRWILARLRVHQLYAKLEKCIFNTHTISFLGYTISPSGIEMDQGKVDCIQNWPRPSTRKALQRFLGFANYYRKFIRNFSDVVKPLTCKTSSKLPYSWDSQAQHAFDKLKRQFCSAPILKQPDPQSQYTLEVDASHHAIGAVLSQRENSKAPLHPIAYFSRTLNPAEVNYAVGEKELLAIKLSLENWRHLLEGTVLPLVILTDHKNLQYLQQTKSLSARQVRWALFFDRFNFIITYRPGTKNGKADSLSRLYEPLYQRDTTTSIIPNTKFLGVTLNLKDEVKANLLAEPPLHIPHLRTDTEGFFYKGTKLYIPPKLQTQVLKLSHDAPLAGHPGITRTLELISRQFWWPSLHKTVTRYVNSCMTCARNKQSCTRPFGLLTNLPIPDGPWQRVSLDFIVDLPPSQENTSILVSVDHFTKMAHFVPLKKLPTAKETADLVIGHIVKLHGLPKTLVTDRGAQFISKFWSALCAKLKIQHSLTSAYHPQSNGQCERINKCLEQYLRCYCTHLQDDWSELLPLAEFAYNNTLSSSTKQTPFYANYGYHPSFFPPNWGPSSNPSTENYLRNLAELNQLLKHQLGRAQASQKRYYDLRRRKNPEYRVGDMVWLSTRNLRTLSPSKKLSALFIGPFPVLSIINEVAVRLQLPEDLHIHPTFHVSLLKPYVPDTFADRTEPPAPPILIQGQEEYEVQEILDSRTYRRRLQYLIRWKTYGPQDDTWEDAANVHAPDLVSAFHRRYPIKPK